MTPRTGTASPPLGPEPALSLALLRIVVAAMMLLAPGFKHGAVVAAWDRSRFVVPEGLGWFVSVVPIHPRAATAVQVLVAFAGLCAIVGVRARLAIGVQTCGAFYLFAIAQLTGFVWHDMHLLWFGALLAASPCDHVLGVDRVRPWDVEGAPYARALLYVRMLLSAVYFFPGLHKLLESGLDWALSDNLVNQLHWKWAQHGAEPAFRLDRHPLLVRAGGAFVLAFELGFPVLVLFRRTRALAALFGLGFHLMSQAFFFIAFASLWACYVALVDVRPALRWVLRRSPVRAHALALRRTDEAEVPRAWPVAVVGALLVGAAFVQGARGQMSSYPFACYPTFQWKAGPTMPDLVLAAVADAGREAEIVHARDRAGRRTQRQWAEIWALAGVTAPISEERLRAYVATQRVPEDMRTIRAYRVERAVAPERRADAPLGRTLVAEFAR